LEGEDLWTRLQRESRLDAKTTCEIVSQVASGLAQLPAAFREAVVLRDLQGLSYEEIAAVLGIRVGTVRSRIARGREQLRLALGRMEA
jgi:RNA polymerase sigma-70 factor, ECF subfamily